MRTIVIAIVLIGFSWSLSAEQLKFDVILMNKKIGEMMLTKTKESKGERYILESESSAKVLFVKKDSKVSFNVLFNNGYLENSLYNSEKKDENIITKVSNTGGQYHVSYNDKKFSLKGNIVFSSILLYFKEPIGVDKIFVERIGDYLPLKKTAAGVYEYHQPDGTRSIYKYEKGKLIEIELKRSLGSVYVRRT